MCFYKNNSKAKIAERDIYVVKKTFAYFVNADDFVAYHQSEFTYKRGVVYKKGWFDEAIAWCSTYLSWEVFHTFNHKAEAFNYSPDSMGVNSMGVNLMPYGLFRIPKGTKYYENEDLCEYATFALEYVGPLETNFKKFKENSPVS